MSESSTVTQTTLTITRTLAAPRELVFRALTDPERLKKWWGVTESHSTPVAEVDLRPGGKYRLGMKGPDSDQVNIVGGTYREVRAPEKLVFTWTWEPSQTNDPPPAGSEGAPMTQAAETLVTIVLRDLGGTTELVLTHEHFPDEHMRDQHDHGWSGALTQLATLLKGEER